MIARIAFAVAALGFTTLIAWLIPRTTAEPDRFGVAQTLIANGRGIEAVYLLDDPVWQGIAKYRAGRYNRALGAFYSEDDPLRLYNMGNAYARLHEWNGAKAAYGRVLRIDPGHTDARHNLELVLRAEEAEREMAEATRPTKRMGRWRDGDREDPEASDTPGSKKERGEADEGEKTAAAERVGSPGESTSPGLTGDEQLSAQAAAGAAKGTPIDGTSGEDLTGAGAALIRRESAQAAEILLNRIRDNPARVLAARLSAMHRKRREGLQ